MGTRSSTTNSITDGHANPRTHGHANTNGAPPNSSQANTQTDGHACGYRASHYRSDPIDRHTKS